jgi:hypothetical protein
MGKELDMFIEIWKERPHFSEISGEPLGSFNVAYFSHILSKGAHPEHRLNKKNIVLKTIEEHTLWEVGNRSKLRLDPKWDKIFKLQEELKTK